MDQIKTIILATGGTGGHIFPALALSEELEKNNYKYIIITDERYKKFVKNYNSKNTFFLPVCNIHKNFFKKILSVLKLSISILQALIILRRNKPDLVIGFGGYASFPTLFAAKCLKLPIMIHEQNSIVGKTNKFFMAAVTKLATSFNVTAGVKEQYKQKIIYTGNPVRKEIMQISDIEYPSFEKIGYLNILIIGGSQGASIFSEVIPAALEKFSPSERNKIKVMQQCRNEDIENVKILYKKINIEAEVVTFFNDVASKLAQANLVISRSGASSIAELCVAKRPAIVVPYPYSAHQHQLHNASVYASSGAGWTMPQDVFTEKTLYELLEKILNDPSILQKAINNSVESCGNSVLRLMEVIEEITNNKN
jgi:UDP-N-acetylglucosamine--N-acetylmuramyl-(pentapeptide) pyrophosphoryl-undecaprenol N-acetylglucosamine transferase